MPKQKDQTYYNKLSLIADKGTDVLTRYHKKQIAKIQTVMDIEAANEIVDLDFNKLLVASDVDFSHDILGIHFNLNRENKTFNNNFMPHCTQ